MEKSLSCGDRAPALGGYSGVVRPRLLPIGKLPAEVLRKLLAAGPPLPPEVRIGPAPGEDACAIELPGGVLVAASDPITLTGEQVGASAVVINANDVAVMGVQPRWFLATVLLPEGTREDALAPLFRATYTALEKLGAALVGGHTEITRAVRQPVVIGQMLGLAEDGRVLSSAAVRPGDSIVQVGPAPIEGAAVLALEASAAAYLPQRARAREALNDPGISVVEPALLARDLGARALHDPTEGGLATGLRELADASALALSIDPARVLWFEPGLELCRAVGADPWGTLASGTLLAAFAPDRVGAALRELEARGHAACEIGRAEAGAGVRATSGHELPSFARDEVARVLAEEEC